MICTMNNKDKIFLLRINLKRCMNAGSKGGGVQMSSTQAYDYRKTDRKTERTKGVDWLCL